MKIFDAIIYLKRNNNNRLYLYFALLALDFKDSTYIFISIINANASAFIVFILKFANIIFKEN